MKKSLLISFILLILLSCQKEIPIEDINETYKKYIYYYFEPGYRESYVISGHDNINGFYSGTLIVETDEEIVENGKTLILVREMLTIKNIGGGSANFVLTTIYYERNGDELYRLYSKSKYGNTEITNKVPIPITAKMGDKGEIASGSDNEGNFSSGSWTLTNSRNGNIYLEEKVTVKDTAGITITTIDTKRTIDINGSYSKINLVFHYPIEDIKLTFEGRKTKDY